LVKNRRTIPDSPAQRISRNTRLRHTDAAVTQLGMDARPAMGAVALAVDRGDRVQQLAVAALARRLRAGPFRRSSRPG
jgi:hypothetical protein